MGIIEQNCRLGVLAFGDSITNGGGELQWGVALQSWALWLARGLGLPYSGYATDGARAGDVVSEQILAHTQRTRPPASGFGSGSSLGSGYGLGSGSGLQPRYELGCLYIGANDVRGLDWDPAAYARDLGTAMHYLSERCDDVLAVTVPLDLGRPRAGGKVLECNRIIERAAGEAGALVLDLSNFGARNLMMADRVHPTAFGQVAIAERALDVLAAAGRPPGRPAVVRPSQLISYQTTRLGCLRGDLTYARRSAKVLLVARWETWRSARRAGGGPIRSKGP